MRPISALFDDPKIRDAIASRRKKVVAGIGRPAAVAFHRRAGPVKIESVRGGAIGASFPKSRFTFGIYDGESKASAIGRPMGAVNISGDCGDSAQTGTVGTTDEQFRIAAESYRVAIRGPSSVIRLIVTEPARRAADNRK